jgi:hypothetical protein
MSEETGQLHLEALLGDALRPIEPPEDLAGRVESTLTAITEQAAAELSSWAEGLSEGELQALRDPRNWVRPVAAVAVGTVAGGALVLVGMRRRRRPTGLRATAENVLKLRYHRRKPRLRLPGSRRRPVIRRSRMRRARAPT